VSRRGLSRQRDPRSWLGCLFGALLVGGLLHHQRLLQAAEWLIEDSLERWRSAWLVPDPELQFVVLDQKSLNLAEKNFDMTWPWLREGYEPLLAFLHRANAKAILFDFIFSEKSSRGVEDDQLLVDAVKAAQLVYFPVMSTIDRSGSSNDLQQPPSPSTDFDRHLIPSALLEPNLVLPEAAAVSNLPLPELLAAAKGIGDVRYTPDPDGVLRRVDPFVVTRGRLLPQFGLSVTIQVTGGLLNSRLFADRLEVDGKRLPLDHEGRLVLRYGAPWTAYPHFSMIDLIQSELLLREQQVPVVDPKTFKDKIVFIGSTAAGLYDLSQVPSGSNVPRVFVNASVLRSVRRGEVLNLRYERWVGWLSIGSLALIGAWIGTLSASRGLLGTVGVTGFYAAMASYLYLGPGIVIDLLAPTIALVLAAVTSLGVSYGRERKRKQFVEGAFAQTLSPVILEQILTDPSLLTAGGTTRHLTVYFSDLVGFTGLSERLAPEQLVAALNIYFAEMVDSIVVAHRGYVDKFIGDAVMAIWGAPVEDRHHAMAAVLAAIDNVSRLPRVRRELAARGIDCALSMRIGIHTGDAIVGMMGSPTKLNYTVIGDSVNLAARLESINKVYGTTIIASEVTVSALTQSIARRTLDRVRVKGKTTPTTLYEIIGRRADLDEPKLRCIDLFEEGLALYWVRDFTSAGKKFEEALHVDPTDGPSLCYLERCTKYLFAPPSGDWDGVWEMKTK